MKSITGVDPLATPAGCANLSTVSRTGEAIVAWRNDRHAARALGFRLVATILGRPYPFRVRQTDTDDTPRAIARERVLFGTLGWQ